MIEKSVSSLVVPVDNGYLFSKCPTRHVSLINQQIALGAEPHDVALELLGQFTETSIQPRALSLLRVLDYEKLSCDASDKGRVYVFHTNHLNSNEITFNENFTLLDSAQLLAGTSKLNHVARSAMKAYLVRNRGKRASIRLFD